MAASVAAFGMTIDLYENWQIIGLEMFLRIVQGIASAMFGTTCLSYLAYTYPDNHTDY